MKKKLMEKNKIDKFLKENIILDEPYFNKIEINGSNVLSEIRKNEQNLNKLFEKKGVAMYSFKEEIEPIVEYIVNEFYKNYKNITWYSDTVIIDFKKYICSVNKKNMVFTIPSSLTKKISFIKNLKINVSILSIKDINIEEKEVLMSSYNSGAILTSDNNLTFFKNRLKKGEVDIGINTFNGIIYPEIVSQNLYHELGHYFQDFNLQRNKNSLYNQTVRNSYYKNKEFFLSSENQYITKIGRILYILFNKNELSQHASSIYGELVELNADINNINSIIIRTETYNKYKLLCKFVKELEKYNYIDIWEATKKFYTTKSHPNGFENISSYAFKEKFIKLSIKYLNEFYKKMMNAAELFVQEKS